MQPIATKPIEKRSDREAVNMLLDQRLFLLNEAEFEVFDSALNAPIEAEQQARIRKLLDTKSPWER